MKLFSTEDFKDESEQTALFKLDTDDNEMSDIKDECDNDLKVATESVLRASNDLFIVGDIKASLESKKLSSVEYFTSIENYNLYLKSINNNLGISVKVPSLEDFKNPYGAKACHTYVMEGFKEIIANIWKKIKEFFAAFFKKVMLFFKRLLNFELELEEYEQYIEDLMAKVKKANRSSVTPIKVPSKLPRLLASEGLTSINADYIMTKGRDKLANLRLINEQMISKTLPGFVSEIKTNIEILAKELKDEKLRVETVKVMQAFGGSIVGKLLGYPVTSSKYLPGDVHEDLTEKFYGNQLSDDSINMAALLAPSSKMSEMPENFNMFGAFAIYKVTDDITGAKISIVAHKEPNTSVDNHLPTIGKLNNLTDLYDFYKKQSKGVNINKLTDLVEKLNKDIDGFNRTLESGFKTALESMFERNLTPPSNLRRNSEGVLEIVPEEDPVTPEQPSQSNQKHAYKASTGVISQGYTNFKNQPYHNPSQKPDDFDFRGLAGLASGGGHDGTPPNDPGSPDQRSPEEEANRANVIELQKFMINFLNVTQSLIREISINLAGTHQECRFELLKYIYLSAKGFVKVTDV